MYDYSSRVLAHRPMADYSLCHCLTYAFYAPLYLAGPTLTFNAFVSHVSTIPPYLLYHSTWHLLKYARGYSSSPAFLREPGL